MPFTTVPDKKDGDVFTEDMWDALIRDNINWLGTFGNLGYQEFAAPVSIPASTPDGAAIAVVALAPITFAEASPVVIDFFAPSVDDASDINILLYVNGVMGCQLGNHQHGSGVAPLAGSLRLTQPAGVATFAARASNGNLASVISAGPGGAGQYVPGFLRCTYGTARTLAVA